MLKWICISKPVLPDGEGGKLMVKNSQTWFKDYASEIL